MDKKLPIYYRSFLSVSFLSDDIPLKPTNVKATVDIKTGKVNLSWTAVTKGINGG